VRNLGGASYIFLLFTSQQSVINKPYYDEAGHGHPHKPEEAEACGLSDARRSATRRTGAIAFTTQVPARFVPRYGAVIYPLYIAMNNTARLLLYTLPHWSGVTVTTTTEKLSDMWIRGEDAAHHSGLPYDPEGISLLRKEILKDFTSAPSTGSFADDGSIETVDDLTVDMRRRQQKPLPSSGPLLARILPEEEVAALSARAPASSKTSTRRKRNS
jgi:hypothetical protein